MKILIADDEVTSLEMLQVLLRSVGFEVTTAHNGLEAFKALRQPDAPRLAVIDLMMPEMDGLEVCRRIRKSSNLAETYIILLTAMSGKDDVVRGLAAGANDYLTKPFDISELQARLRVGQNVLELQDRLSLRVAELEMALEKVKRLQGLLPICSHCKRIRDDDNYWQAVDQYITDHSDVAFSHSICPDCYDTHMRPALEQMRIERSHHND